MILEQLYLECLAQASYFILDETTKTAVVVDPRRDVDVYLERAKSAGAKIEHVLLTHFHADFLSGHLELREATGATIHLGAGAKAEFEFEEMVDGGKLALGDVLFEFLSTPGHTPESTSILVYDLAGDRDQPYAVLTGDTLFIGDVGRPDLLGSTGLTPETLAGWMYDSLREKLLPLPDATLVYPGHGAGSACGKNLSSETFSTMGQQRALNYALQDMERDEFVRLLTADQPDAPAYFPHDAKMNRSRHATLSAVLERSLVALPLDEVLDLQSSGAQVVDTRDADAFFAGHLKESINVGLSGKYASWVGTVCDADKAIVILCEPGRERESIERLGRIGFDHVHGYLEGGFASVARDPALVAKKARLTTEELTQRIEADEPPVVVDVRTPTEWEAGHIEGAIHLPLARLPRELDSLPRGREIVCVCKTGYRSSTAASLLARAKFTDVTDLAGGMDAWSGIDSEAPSCSG